jgi:hypothetical protein
MMHVTLLGDEVQIMMLSIYTADRTRLILGYFRLISRILDVFLEKRVWLFA